MFGFFSKHNRQLALTIVDENARLPEVHDVFSLCAQGQSSRATLLAGSTKHANEWYERCVSAPGGPAVPRDWDGYYQTMYSAPVQIYRQLGAHWSPGTGAIVCGDGAVLKTSCTSGNRAFSSTI